MIKVYHYIKKRIKPRPIKGNKWGKMEMSITELGKLGEVYKTFWKVWEKCGSASIVIFFLSNGKWKSNRLKWQNALLFAENLKIANFEWGQLYKVSEIKEKAKYLLSFFFFLLSHCPYQTQSTLWHQLSLLSGSQLVADTFYIVMNCLKILEEI